MLGRYVLGMVKNCLRIFKTRIDQNVKNQQGSGLIHKDFIFIKQSGAILKHQKRDREKMEDAKQIVKKFFHKF